MVNSTLAMVWQQLTFNTPLLLVMLIAISLSLASWRKARTAAMLTLTGAVLILAVSLLAGVIRVVLIQNLSASNSPQWHMLISAFSSLGFAAGLLLIVVAVFVDRPSRSR